MDIDNLKEHQKAEIDLHGLTAFDAETALFAFVDAQPKTVKLVTVTHGYSRGTALKKMVQRDFHHWRVTGKRVGLNPGVTLLLLK